MLLLILALLLTSAAAQPPSCGDKDDWCFDACADQPAEKHLHIVPGGQDCLCSCKVSAFRTSTCCRSLWLLLVLRPPAQARDETNMTGASTSRGRSRNRLVPGRTRPVSPGLLPPRHLSLVTTFIMP